MAALMERVFDALREALAAAPAPTTIAPPPDAAESALKGLRRLPEPADGATAEQRRVGADALAALRAPGTEAHAKLLCAAVRRATAAIDAIDRDAAADTAAAGLTRWGHLRVNAASALLQLASTELASVELLERTDGAAAAACVGLLASRAARADAEGVRVGATLLRNLCMPRLSRARVGALGPPAAADALLPHVGHREPAVAGVVAACLRLLVEGCDANAWKFARAGAASAGDAAAAPAAGAAFAPLTELELDKLHPFARAELARFVSLTIASVCGGGDGGADDAAAQRALVSTAALRFGPCFLLSSRHATLHQEAAAALGACAALGAAAVAWEPSALGVQRDGQEVALADALRALVQGGTPTLTPAECAGLL